MNCIPKVQYLVDSILTSWKLNSRNVFNFLNFINFIVKNILTNKINIKP